MKKIFYKARVTITRAPDKSGAPFTVDGVHYFNRGEVNECAFSECEGYGFRKDANTRYDLGSDVGAYSVKSARARLTTAKLATERDTFIAEYLRTEKSDGFVWSIWDGVQGFTFYLMNREEFTEMVFTFCGWDGTPRLPDNTKALLQWLEERVRG